MKKRNLLAMVSLALFATVLFAACSQGGLSGKITVEGSTSVSPLAEILAEAFMEDNDKIEIEVLGNGSSAGVKAANAQSANIGMSSRNLKDAEKEYGLTEHIIAYDAIAVVVHPNNPVSELTSEQISKIFKGEIKNWNEVGGNDSAIIVISREAGSGTRGAFEKLLDFEDALIADALIAEGNGAVKANVKEKEYSIGYLSLGYLTDEMKSIVVDGVVASTENVLVDKYGIKRPFLMLTKGEISKETKEFIDFIMSEKGQKIVANKYIPVK